MGKIRDLELIGRWDWPDYHYKHECECCHTENDIIIDATPDNMKFLEEKYNELVKTLKERLCE
jgi:hypothetical protein